MIPSLSVFPFSTLWLIHPEGAAEDILFSAILLVCSLVLARDFWGVLGKAGHVLAVVTIISTAGCLGYAVISYLLS